MEVYNPNCELCGRELTMILVNRNYSPKSTGVRRENLKYGCLEYYCKSHDCGVIASLASVKRWATMFKDNPSPELIPHIRNAGTLYRAGVKIASCFKKVE